MNKWIKISLILLLLLIVSIVLYGYLYNNMRYQVDNDNVDYYTGKNIKVDGSFKWIEIDGVRYHKMNGYMYRNGWSIRFLPVHPFFKVDGIKYKKLETKKHNIPKVIWQTLDKLPEKGSHLDKTSQTFRDQKGWEYRFVDDNQAEKFLADNFEPEVLNCFKVLNAGAFKADLLRACLLYIHGGVYADIKLKCLVPLDSFLDNDLVLVDEIDKDIFASRSQWGIWNGFMAAIPKHPYFKKVIDRIVKNISNLYYPTKEKELLSITGPILYGKTFVQHFECKDIESRKGVTILCAINVSHPDTKHYISRKKDYQMLITWPKIRQQYTKHMKNDYSKLFWDKKIYDLELHKKLFPPENSEN